MTKIDTTTNTCTTNWVVVHVSCRTTVCCRREIPVVWWCNLSYI